MVISVTDRLREALPALPRAERRVAMALLRHYPVAGLETVARLAEAAETSGPTVLRLVTRLGFDGFPSFQQALRGDVGDRTTSPLSQLDHQPPVTGNTVDRARSVLAESVDSSLRNLDSRTYDAVVDRLIDGRRVVTTGGRFSGLAATALALHLEILRDGVQHLRDDMRVSYLLGVRKSDVVVVFDVRRYQRASIDFGREAKRKGATVILVTDPWLSPLAFEADLVLSVAVVGPSPFDTQVPVSALVETLIASVTEKLGNAPRARLTEYDRLWDNQRFGYLDDRATDEETVT